jgi:hypothetical protein
MKPPRFVSILVLLAFAVPHCVFALPAPSISSVSPNPVTGVALPGRVSITLNGSNFVSKPAISLTWTGGSANLSSPSVTFVSSKRVDIAVVTNVTADKWTVKATNPDGQQSNSASFQVVVPVVSSITPKPLTGAAPSGGVNVARNKPTAASGDAGKAFTVPVLTVDSNASGACQHVKFALTRKVGSNAPLSLAIAENTPGGAGETLRASVWMAAMVTALDRLDDLSGVNISLELDGSVDGPSAGGVLCLAMMSALNGRSFPADIAMTGTIMPDGTIGSVGAIAVKMRAAAKVGVTRVIIPAFLRFEKDARTNQEIDLRRLAVELKLKLLPVDNISQAYAVTHGIERPTLAKAGSDVLDIPEATEELLKKRYQNDLASGLSLWSAISEDDQKLIAADPLTKAFLIDSRIKAENAYRTGRLLYASTYINLWRVGIVARKENIVLLNKLPNDGRVRMFKQMDDSIALRLKEVPTASDLVKASHSHIWESGTQLCAEYCEVHMLSGLMSLLSRGFDLTIANLAKEENKGEASQTELLQNAFGIKTVQLWFAHVISLSSKDMVKDAAEMAATLKSRKSTGNAAAIERLFYSAFQTANHSFLKDVIAEAATELKVTQDQALEAMMEHDFALTMYLPVAKAGASLHAEIARGGGNAEDSFNMAAAAHIHANSLASISGIISRWSVLEPEIKDTGELRYGRNDLLNYLLTSARENALSNIARCKKRGIPCIQPIACFENAELGRDDPDEDKVSVLSAYWNASLQAKVLLMMFPSTSMK